MSNIPSSAIPHAWVHDDDEAAAAAKPGDRVSSSAMAIIAGLGAFAAYLLYRAVR